MDCDIISGFVATIAAAGFGAWIAARIAVGQWRAEMVARRRADVAEVALTELYKFRDRLNDAVINYGLSVETAKNDDDLRLLFNKASNDIDLANKEFIASRSRFQAVFGRDTGNDYLNIHHASRRALVRTGEAFSKTSRDIFIITEKVDEFLSEIDDALVRLEKLYRAALNAEDER